MSTPRLSKAALWWVNAKWNWRMPYENYPGAIRSLDEAMRKGGKCHNYVEGKGRELQGKGVPLRHLKIGIGYTLGSSRSEPHSVLIYRGLVLDNRNYRILPLRKVDGKTMRVTDKIPFAHFFKTRTA